MSQKGKGNESLIDDLREEAEKLEKKKKEIETVATNVQLLLEELSLEIRGKEETKKPGKTKRESRESNPLLDSNPPMVASGRSSPQTQYYLGSDQENEGNHFRDDTMGRHYSPSVSGGLLPSRTYTFPQYENLQPAQNPLSPSVCPMYAPSAARCNCLQEPRYSPQMTVPRVQVPYTEPSRSDYLHQGYHQPYSPFPPSYEEANDPLQCGRFPDASQLSVSLKSNFSHRGNGTSDPGSDEVEDEEEEEEEDDDDDDDDYDDDEEKKEEKKTKDQTQEKLRLADMVKAISFFAGQWGTASRLGRQVQKSPEEIVEVAKSREDIFSVLKDEEEVVIELVPKISLCLNYLSTEGCSSKDSCQNLHLCKYFVLEICRYDSDCAYSHKWDTNHNDALLSKLYLDIIDKSILHDVVKKVCKSRITPLICSFYNGKTGCNFGDRCLKLHICKDYVYSGGNCSVKNCDLNHQIRSAPCIRILRNFGVSQKEAHQDILKLLSVSTATSFQSCSKQSTKSTDVSQVREESGTAHGSSSVEASSSKIKIKVCKYYNGNNGCKFGKGCRFLHICNDYLTSEGRCSIKDCNLNHQIRSPQCSRILNNSGVPVNEDTRNILKRILSSPATSLHASPKSKKPQNLSSARLELVDLNEIWDTSSEDSCFSEYGYVGYGGYGVCGGFRSLYKGCEKSKGKIRTLKSNDVLGDVKTAEICLYNMDGKCENEKKGCEFLHAKSSFHWQVQKDEKWYNYRAFQSKILETAFRDVSKNAVQVPPLDPKNAKMLLKIIGTDPWCANFQRMTVTKYKTGEMLRIRRVSTRSSAVSDNPKATVFNWYFCSDKGNWILYGEIDGDEKVACGMMSSEEIEKEYLSNPNGYVEANTPQYKYRLNFAKMVQVNINTKKETAMRRRPSGCVCQQKDSLRDNKASSSFP